MVNCRSGKADRKPLTNGLSASRSVTAPHIISERDPGTGALFAYNPWSVEFSHRIAFADRQVDVQTGTIKVAVLFPNPGNVLRPGQFARVRAQRSVKTGALLVPQRAVMEQQGSYQVAVVGADQKVDIRPVKVGQQVGSLWVIDDGVRAGERVIVEGLQKVRPGMVVAAAPYAPPAAASPTTEPSTATPAAPVHQAKR